MKDKKKYRILVVDDQDSHRDMLRANLAEKGYSVSEAASGEEAVAAVEEGFVHLVLMDIRMAQMGGIEALEAIKKISPGIPVIMMTAYGSVDSAVHTMKLGAFDYLTKPLDIDETRHIIQKAIEKHYGEQANIRPQAPGAQIIFPGIAGESKAMQEMLEVVALVAPSDATVLITGDSGTGKELVARAVHDNSLRKEGPFVAVNCAALSESVLESELFGHEKGAFTGANRQRIGRFEAANNGTIFLDEIADMTQNTQAKILRILQLGEFQRLGSNKTHNSDVRVIAATNRDLKVEVEAGKFREDLFFRLNVVPIHLPSLRDRREDIPALAEHFKNVFAKESGKNLRSFTPEALDRLMRYDWPGNVRELENIIERAVILCRGERITPELLPLSLRETEPSEEELPTSGTLKEMEKRLILKTLDETGGNKTKAAEMLGITRQTLFNKLKEYDIH